MVSRFAGKRNVTASHCGSWLRRLDYFYGEIDRRLGLAERRNAKRMAREGRTEDTERKVPTIDLLGGGEAGEVANG